MSDPVTSAVVGASTAMNASNVAQSLSMSMTKKTMDFQKQEAMDLVSLAKTVPTPSSGSTGRRVNITV